MKIKKLLRFVFTVLIATAGQSFAIEGLTIQVPSNNVVLSWASDTSETYLIQYRHTLDATDSWSTLADYYPPDYSGTNITFFIDTNIDYGITGSGGSSGGSILLNSMQRGSNKSLTMEEIMEMLMPPLPTSGNTISQRRSFGGSPVPMGEDDSNNTNNGIAGTGFYQVVRDGTHLVGITNGMVLSGIVKIPVELGNASGDVSILNISEDGTPVGNSIQIAPITPVITLDTTLMANGTHYIYGTARWDDTNGGLWEADSPTITITTSNEITFENWMPTFGETGDMLLFRATSAHTNTDWNVYIYDNTNGYRGYFTGHTDNGDITFYWDQTGTIYTNIPSFTFELETEYIDPKTPPTYKVTDPWTSSGGFVIASQHAFDGYIDHDLLYDEYSSGFLSGAQSEFSVRPSPSSGNPFALPFQTTGEYAAWATFRSALYNNASRNICYFGHGGGNGIGYNSHDTNVFISATEIGNVLHTIPAGQTNRHAFRFVFLDGCSTAKGTLPEAFGILHKKNVPLIDYYNSSTRPSAFCGWSSDKVVANNFGNNINYDHVNFISHIQTYMFLYSGTISDAITYAAEQPDVVSIFTSQFECFGCSDITFGAFNN